MHKTHFPCFPYQVRLCPQGAAVLCSYIWGWDRGGHFCQYNSKWRLKRGAIKVAFPSFGSILDQTTPFVDLTNEEKMRERILSLRERALESKKVRSPKV